MAGIGPPPKPASVRQRRNKKGSARVLRAPDSAMPRDPSSSTPQDESGGAGRGGAADHDANVPSTDRRNWQLPDHPLGLEWHPLTLEWWSHIWRSPMATEYLETDADGLHRLAILIDHFYRKPSATSASEIRLQEARFGLSPVDRARLQWEVDKGEEAGDRRRKRRPAEYEPLDSEDPSADSGRGEPRDPRRVLGNLVKPDWPVERKQPRTRTGRFRARVVTPEELEERSS